MKLNLNSRIEEITSNLVLPLKINHKDVHLMEMIKLANKNLKFDAPTITKIKWKDANKKNLKKNIVPITSKKKMLRKFLPKSKVKPKDKLEKKK